MKTKKLSKKLSLNKNTIAHLSDKAQKDVNGGIKYCVTAGAHSCPTGNIVTCLPNCP